MEVVFYSLGSFIIGVLIARWVFGIDTMIKANKTQIGLLILMAKKQGATKEEIDEVLDKVYGKK